MLSLSTEPDVQLRLSQMKTLRRAIKRLIGTNGNPFLPARSLAHLEAVRTYELQHVLGSFPPRCRVLEIGAGSGWQARHLSKLGFDVHAIDIASSNYSTDRVWPVEDYDGFHIPYPDRSFDCVFSSNAMEHIPHVREFQAEISRVLKDSGVVVHLVPSASWRFWTNLTNPIRYFSPPLVHGEHSANALTEIWRFRRAWWNQLFRATGWSVISARGNELFYTGCSVADAHLSMKRRRVLSRYLGSACNVFVLKKASPPGSSQSR